MAWIKVIQPDLDTGKMGRLINDQAIVSLFYVVHGAMRKEITIYAHTNDGKDWAIYEVPLKIDADEKDHQEIFRAVAHDISYLKETPNRITNLILKTDD